MGSGTGTRRRRTLALIGLAFVAFVALGLPDGLLGVGWPSIRATFDVPLDAVGVLLAAVVVGYTTSSFLSGVLLSRLGVGLVLASSCLLTGTALIGYTVAPHWGVVVLLGVAAGLGAGAVDAGLNTYVAEHFGEGLMQWLHASWGVGITAGPIIMTLGLTTLDSWEVGYRVVGGFQIALAVCFGLTLSLWDREDAAPDGGEAGLTEYQTPMGATLREPGAWLSVALFFLYVGAESSLGIWVFTLLTESRGVEEALAGVLAGSYWFTFTVGRIAAGAVAGRVGGDRLVVGGLVGALLGAGVLLWNASELTDVVAVSLIGLSIAPIFPAMMSGTRRRVGARHAANTIGMQMAATGLGTAVVPGLMGVLARRMSLEVIPASLLAVYAGLLGVYLLAGRSPGPRQPAFTGDPAPRDPRFWHPPPC